VLDSALNLMDVAFLLATPTISTHLIHIV